MNSTAQYHTVTGSSQEDDNVRQLSFGKTLTLAPSLTLNVRKFRKSSEQNYRWNAVLFSEVEDYSRHQGDWTLHQEFAELIDGKLCKYPRAADPSRRTELPNMGSNLEANCRLISSKFGTHYIETARYGGRIRFTVTAAEVLDNHFTTATMFLLSLEQYDGQKRTRFQVKCEPVQHVNCRICKKVQRIAQSNFTRVCPGMCSRWYCTR